MLWDIPVSRLQVATKTIRVEADTLEQAEEAALSAAPNEDFGGCVTEYDFETNGGTPVADESADPNPLQTAVAPKVETCALCDNEMPETVEAAIEEGWLPDYYIGEEQQAGPVCPDCAEHKCHWDEESGELTLNSDEER